MSVRFRCGWARSLALLLFLTGLPFFAPAAEQKLPPKPRHEQPTFKPAYPPSPVIARVTFDDWTARTAAEGSDIWPVTWAVDDHLYTAWGDGGGFGGTYRDGRVKLGVARIEGGRSDYTGTNLAGGKAAPHPAPFAGKSEGILALGDTLYLWRDNDHQPTAGCRSTTRPNRGGLGRTLTPNSSLSAGAR